VQAYDAIKSIDAQAQVSIAHNMPFFNAVAPGSLGQQLGARDQQEYFYNSHFLNSLTAGTVDKRIDRRRPPEDRDPDETSEGFFGIPASEWLPKLDFIGLNYYRSVYAYYFLPIALRAPFAGGAFTNDLYTSSDPHNLLTDPGWEISPTGFLETLRGLHADYGLPIMITKNGVGEAEERYRPPFTTAHLAQIEQAVAEDIPVLGYFHWSLLDNFEWQYNFAPKARFGLYRVDRDATFANGQAALTRRITESALTLQYAIVQGAASAGLRWGSVESGGRWVTKQTASPGRLWQGQGRAGPRLALYLAPLVNGAVPWLGMIFDYAARRWTRLDHIRWDPAKRTLEFSHLAKAASPERHYVAVAYGDQLAGTYAEGGNVTPWQANRVLAHAVWETSLPFGPIALRSRSRHRSAAS
jgi:Glycosyl hydrolase family 1